MKRAAPSPRVLRPLMVLALCGVAAHSLAQSSGAQSPSVTAPDFSKAIGSFLSGPGIDAEAKRQQQQSALVAASVKVNEASQAPSFGAKLSQAGGELRYGAHNVVSKDGERIVWAIRSLATAKPADQGPFLALLKSQADAKAPEALNFLGFAAEYGLFGMRQDERRAADFYSAAAHGGYQPAIYNLALISAYGRLGAPDLGRAAMLLGHAAAIGGESSSRVCGMASFVNVRRAELPTAVQLARGCGSPLAVLAVEKSATTPVTPQRLEDLRKAVATGVEDGYVVLEQATRRNALADDQYLFCKYALLNRFRLDHKTEILRSQALKCYDAVSERMARQHPEPMRREQVAAGIASFVPAEASALDALRKSNRFHYGWSTPYLPFGQGEVDIFEPLIAGAATSATHPAQASSGRTRN